MKTFKAIKQTEGAGVSIYRSIGTAQIKNHDPFVMLDFFGSDAPNEYLSGFPAHPHRGFNTFTYMIDGEMEHQDSMGNQGIIKSGGAQWMKAASGVIHSEMPKQKSGLMRGFQLWINLPAKHKMDSPTYQEYHAEDFPSVTDTGYTKKIIIGESQGHSSPIRDEISQTRFLDISLSPEQIFTENLNSDHVHFLYLFEGEMTVNNQVLQTHTLVVLENGESELIFKTGAQEARFILVSGKPIGEPIVQYGPFVMNSREEIQQAINDFNSGKFNAKRS